MKVEFVRTLRTPSSERFLAAVEGKDVAAFEIHYGHKGEVDGTVIVLDEHYIPETAVGQLLSRFDDCMLPHVNIADGNVRFTVVRGSTVGAFEPHK